MAIRFKIGHILFGGHRRLSTHFVTSEAKTKKSRASRETQEKQYNTRHGHSITS